MSLRVALIPAAFVAAALGCQSPSASLASEAPGDPGPATAEPAAAEPPPWLLLPWGSELAARPGGPPVLRLVAPHEGEAGPGRVVRARGSEEGWWQVETVDELALLGLDAAEPIEHLEVFELRLYVPAGTGAAITTPEAANAEDTNIARVAANVGVLGVLGDPPLQSGQLRAVEMKTDWRVSPGAKVYWPDGSEAGEVRVGHAFADAGTLVETEVGALRCQPIVAGPTRASLGQLCYEPDALVEAEISGSGVASILSSDLDAAIFEAELESLTLVEGATHGAGGLGLRGTGSGGGGMGSGVVGGLAEGGGGRGGSGGMGRLGTGRGGGGAAEELPELEPSSIVAEGPEQAATERAVEARLRTLARCVAAAEEGEAELGEELEIGFELEIDADGKVLDARVEAPDEELAECVERKLRRWRFVSGAPGRVIVELALESST